VSTRVPWQAKFTALAVIWGASFLLMKIGLQSLQPLQVATLRVLTGAATILVVASMSGVRLPRQRRVWLHLAVSGFFLCSLPFTLFPLGEERVTSALAGIGNATTPLATVVFGMALIPAYRLSARKLSAVLLGFLGVIVIMQPWASLGRPDLLGFGMTLVAGASYGLGWTYLKRFLGPGDVGGLSLPAAQLSMSAVQMIVLVTCWWLVHRDTLAAPWSTVPGSGPAHWPVVAVLGLGIVGTGLAFSLQFDVMRAVGPTVGATVTYVIPVVAVVLGIVFLHERLHWPQVVGAVIVLCAAVVTGLPDRRPGVPSAKDSEARATPAAGKPT
jgi:drug/metabolite transporter (DMT)-like permease